MTIDEDAGFNNEILHIPFYVVHGAQMPTIPAPGDIIDGRYEVTGVCSTAGGMGALLFVKDRNATNVNPLVMKYCKATDDPSIKRFKRETRLLNQFRGNTKVAQLYALNTDHDPPYYVMAYYEDGDLEKRSDQIQTDPSLQERVFIQMIDCVAQLHAANVYHRDIKPQNFLINGSDIVVSDLGLSMERESLTSFTSTAEAWGTQGFIPPEFRHGGFKDADAPGDVFMLGKSFYVLLSGRDPLYLVPDNIHPAIFSVIERCCAIDKTRRYQRLAQLKQALVSAYDVILNRVHGPDLARRMLAEIMDLLVNANRFNSQQIIEFLNLLSSLAPEEQESICQSLKPEFFHVVGQQPFISHHMPFLVVYDKMVQKGNYSWAFAERIATCVKTFIDVGQAEPKAIAAALDAAIRGAVAMNRFAAMDTCTQIITSINNEAVAIAVRDVIAQHPATFVANIEPVQCRHELVAQAIRTLKTAQP